MFSFRLHLATISVLVVAVISGCGGGTDSTPSADSSPQVISNAGTRQNLPNSDSESSPANGSDSSPDEQNTPAAARITASIASPESQSVDASETPETKNAGEADEATKILREIQQLRLGSVPADLEQARKTRRDRNEQIIEMATNVLRLTMNNEGKEPLFNQAIGQLLEARFQMALAGNQTDVDQLYADVEAIASRDPKSAAAAEGVYYIAKFAHTKAGMLGKTQPEWFTTLSQWAREFADRFPEQQNRAVTMLFGAGLSCELHSMSSADTELAKRLMTEAKLCYTALAEKFPESTQGQKATATLRRMALAGQKLSQFSGPTLDGGFVSVDDFSGKPTLIYFWSSEDKEFTDDLLPLLQRIRSQVPGERLRIVGVALDDAETELNAFMESHEVPGQQIFFPNPDQRSWNSPLVVFWGIARSPAVWLVDKNGVVITTTSNSKDLGSRLQAMLK